jgi:hypothetical protein
VSSLLDQVPEEPNDGKVDRRIRYGNLILAAAASGVTLAAVHYLLSIQ